MQFSFFDESDRLEKLTDMGDSLAQLNAIVKWEIFVPVLDHAIQREKSAKGGRPPFDNLLMFKILVIKRLFNLSYDQTEFQINDRISFMRFLGLRVKNRIPDAKTIWLYENRLAENEAGKKLFDMFFAAIERKGYITRSGSIAFASCRKPLFLLSYYMIFREICRGFQRLPIFHFR